MKKNKFIFLSVGVTILTALFIYLYINESYVCNTKVESKTTYSNSNSADEVNSYSLSFGFAWNQFTKKIMVSSIDELAIVDFHLRAHYSAIEENRNHNSFITSDAMGIYFGSDRDAFLHKTKDSFSFESSTLDFDKKSKYIIITKIEDRQIAKTFPQVSRNVKISGSCSRVWGF